MADVIFLSKLDENFALAEVAQIVPKYINTAKSVDIIYIYILYKDLTRHIRITLYYYVVFRMLWVVRHRGKDYYIVIRYKPLFPVCAHCDACAAHL